MHGGFFVRLLCGKCVLNTHFICRGPLLPSLVSGQQLFGASTLIKSLTLIQWWVCFTPNGRETDVQVLLTKSVEVAVCSCVTLLYA